MMETTKATSVMKRWFGKESRSSTLLGIAGWACLALGLMVLGLGVWRQFHSAGGPMVATYRDETLYVEAMYGKEAQIPKNAELRAAQITPESDPDTYSQMVESALATAGTDGTDLPVNAIYDVGFYVDGQEVEPAAPVNVIVQVLHDGFAVGSPIKVVHLKEDGAEVIADTSVNEAGFVSFTTDSFSSFAFIIPSGDGRSDAQNNDKNDDQGDDRGRAAGDRLAGDDRALGTGAGQNHRRCAGRRSIHGGDSSALDFSGRLRPHQRQAGCFSPRGAPG